MSTATSEGYIDMELTTSSPPKTTEFEFQLEASFSGHQKQADELFYKGKILPLTPFREPPLPAGSSESCRLSCDRDYYNYNPFPDFSGELSRFPAKTPPQKKLKLGQKLKASRAYLKSLFLKMGKRSVGEIVDNGRNNIQRRSFSDTIRRHSPASSESSSSSSSFSMRSNGHYEPGFFRRDSSASEIEASIDAAIDHCKKSMQIFRAINSVEDDKRVVKSSF